MQVPKMFEGESFKRLAQGVAVGAVATMIIGFGWGGWVLGGTAEKMAAQRTTAMAVALYTPVCVEKFQQQANLPVQWAALKKVSEWNRDSFIKDAGFATLPGTKVGNSDVANSCAAALTEILNKQGPVAQK